MPSHGISHLRLLTKHIYVCSTIINHIVSLGKAERLFSFEEEVVKEHLTANFTCPRRIQIFDLPLHNYFEANSFFSVLLLPRADNVDALYAPLHSIHFNCVAVTQKLGKEKSLL